MTDDDSESFSVAVREGNFHVFTCRDISSMDYTSLHYLWSYPEKVLFLKTVIALQQCSQQRGWWYGHTHAASMQ